MSTETGLVFPAKGKRGFFEVSDETGLRVAGITRRGSQLTAEDTAGRVLFTAKINRERRWWIAKDANGDTLVELRQRRLHRWPHVLLRDGNLAADYDGPHSLLPKWNLVGSDGEVLLASEPHNPRLFNKPWLVRSSGTLTLSELVAVVQMHQLNVRVRSTGNNF
jgi:hypothetical protein